LIASAPHIETIVAAYAIAAAAIAAMIAYVWLDYRALSIRAAKLEGNAEVRKGRSQ
jgi:hypothetical protein